MTLGKLKRRTAGLLVDAARGEIIDQVLCTGTSPWVAKDPRVAEFVAGLTDAVLKAEWLARRGRLVAWYAKHGRRPWGWWMLDDASAGVRERWLAAQADDEADVDALAAKLLQEVEQ